MPDLSLPPAAPRLSFPRQRYSLMVMLLRGPLLLYPCSALLSILLLLLTKETASEWLETLQGWLFIFGAAMVLVGCVLVLLLALRNLLDWWRTRQRYYLGLIVFDLALQSAGVLLFGQAWRLLY